MDEEKNDLKDIKQKKEETNYIKKISQPKKNIEKKYKKKNEVEKNDSNEIAQKKEKQETKVEDNKEKNSDDKNISKNKKDNVTEKQKEFKQVKTKEKKKAIPVIIITTIICLLLLFSIIFSLFNINNNKIFSNLYINGIDVSKLSKEEAIEKIEEVINDKLEEEMTLKYKDYETTMNANQINAKFDIENAVNQAYNVGRTGNIITNNYAILSTMLSKKNIEIKLYYDQDELKNRISDISSKIPGTVTQSSYYIDNDKLIIVKGKSGIKAKNEDLGQMIINSIKQLGNKSNIIEIPVEEANPDAIDLEKIRSEIYKEPQDAYVSKNPTTVHTHVNGVDFKISMEDAKKLLKEEKEEYVIPLKITVPSKTIKDLGEEAFPNQISTYSTRYDISNRNRSNNLSIAASKINGTIVMPGETFSYNKVVGERTISAGYKEAGAYAGGKVIQSVGGGICQVSSTLYNTALLANLDITDRSNHAFLTGYVEPSRDATVSWGTLDFKFKNTRSYPIKIEASAQNGVCKMSIYGIKEETEYEVVIQSRVLSYIPYTVRYVENSNLEKGKEVIEQSGQNGCISEAYKILRLNGKVISKTLLSKDTYDPMQRIVKKGTKE